MTQLNIYLHKKKIGVLTLLPGDRNLFTFEEEYLNDKNRPTLSLSFKEKNSGEMIDHVSPTQTKLPAFFSNLLPEGQLREYLAAIDNIHPEREFFLLRAFGLDLPGAIAAKADVGEAWPKEIFVNHKNHLQKDSLRFSLAGVQLKFSALAAPTGKLTIPVHGIGGEWIVKLPSLRFPDVPENEFAMMSMAKKIGINIPEIKLVDLNHVSDLPKNIGKIKGKIFAIKRFDRSEHGPVHMEDFAQIFNLYPAEKYGKINYKNIAEVLWAETGLPGLTEFIRRLVFNILIGNADMHAKNWSLIYPDKIHAELSPAYDFVSTIVYLEDDSMALNFIKSKKWQEIELKQFVNLAAKIGSPEIPILNTVKETVSLFQEVWHTDKKHLNLDSDFISAIDKHIKSVPIAHLK